ncbi:hypothetical protein GGF32_004283 [Allomyces javanicus]|nr:hypothetical protein GGF32_004283 [Allomyces javanicus]
MFGLYQPAPVVVNDIWERWDDDDWWDEGPVEGGGGSVKDEGTVEDEERSVEDDRLVEDEGPDEIENGDEDDETDDEGSIVIVGGGYYEVYSEEEYDDDNKDLEAERAPLPLEGPMIMFPLGIEPRPLMRFRWRAKLRAVNMRLTEPMTVSHPAAREFGYDREERRWTVRERWDW